MARAKLYCKGKTQDGRPCNNWALKGSYYCQLHQRQETEQDRNQMQNTQMISCFVIVAFLVVAFLISLAVGCDDKFLKWLTK